MDRDQALQHVETLLADKNKPRDFYIGVACFIDSCRLMGLFEWEERCSLSARALSLCENLDEEQ